MKKLIWCFIMFLVVGLSLYRPDAAVAMGRDYSRSQLDLDQNRAEQLVETLPIEQVLGPLAPVALSPFFGITCLSGTSILSNKGVLPENQFLQGNRALNNGYVFLSFLLLTIATSIPKFTTPTKAVAELTDQVETYAGIISYGLILAMTNFSANQQDSMIVYQAGIFSFTAQQLLIVAAALNIFVINSVKFFFELLVLISPIPLLDAAFETANKTFAAVLAVIYAFSPWLAFLLNLLLFLICLAVFKWTRRRIHYLKAMLLDPVFVKLFGIRQPDKRFIQKYTDLIGEGVLLAKVFPSRKLGKLKRKDRCYLLNKQEDLVLVKPRVFRKPVIHSLDRPHCNLSRGLFRNVIETKTDTGKQLDLYFSKIYNQRLDEIMTELGVSPEDGLK